MSSSQGHLSLRVIVKVNNSDKGSKDHSERTISSASGARKAYLHAKGMKLDHTLYRMQRLGKRIRDLNIRPKPIKTIRRKHRRRLYYTGFV